MNSIAKECVTLPFFIITLFTDDKIKLYQFLELVRDYLKIYLLLSFNTSNCLNTDVHLIHEKNIGIYNLTDFAYYK